MPVLVLHLVLTLSALCGAPAHPPSHDAVPQPPPGPPIVFDTTSIDLGPIPDTAIITRTFRFTNMTPRPIRLVIGGCHHCGVPTSDKPVYQPSESGVVIVELNPIARRGPMRAGGIVSVAGVVGFNVQLDLLAEVRPRVWFEHEPGELTLAVRGVGSRTTWTMSGRGAGFRIERAVVTGDDLSVAVAEPIAAGTPDDPWTSQAVTLTVDPRAPSGSVSGSLSIFTNDQHVQQREFAVTGDVVGDAFAEPSPITLGERDPASPFVAQFLVRSRRGQPVQVLDIDIADPGQCSEVAADLIPAPDLDGWVVRVVGCAPAARVIYTDVIVALRSVGADGVPEVLRFNTRMSVRRAGRGVPARHP